MIADSDDDQESAGKSDNDEDGEVHNVFESLPETSYGLLAASLIRDCLFIQQGADTCCLRVARIISSIVLIIFTLWIQVCMLMAVAFALADPAVERIRKLYDNYEHHMYPASALHNTSNGYSRGTAGMLIEDNFKTADQAICDIALAHTGFAIGVLGIWTLTCMFEFRKCSDLGLRVLWTTPCVDSLTEGVKRQDDMYVVEGLPRVFKLLFVIFVVVPRYVTLGALLFLGSRWLLATVELNNLILNGLALEFVLLLPELFYNVLVPARSQHAVTKTMVLPFRQKEEVTVCTLFDTYALGLLSVIWVLLYVFKLQAVLPDYQWDVRPICHSHSSHPSIV